MDEFLQWMAVNSEWVFSGVGVALVVLISGVVFRRRQKPAQQIRSGDRSNNIQAGRDIRIETKSNHTDAEK